MIDTGVVDQTVKQAAWAKNDKKNPNRVPGCSCAISADDSHKVAWNVNCKVHTTAPKHYTDLLKTAEQLASEEG